jgi:polar amino acid transport system substrate-binding protein
VRKGTTAEQLLRDHGGHAAMQSESNKDLYNALAIHQLDGVIDDSPIALHFSRVLPGLRYSQYFEGTQAEYAIMLRRGNDRLQNRINAALDAMESDGTLPRLRKQWFGSENIFVGAADSNPL